MLATSLNKTVHAYGGKSRPEFASKIRTLYLGQFDIGKAIRLNRFQRPILARLPLELVLRRHNPLQIIITYFPSMNFLVGSTSDCLSKRSSE